LKKKIEFYLGLTKTETNDARPKQYDGKTKSNVRPIQRRCPLVPTTQVE